MELLREYPQRVWLGTTHEGDEIYIDRPQWSCEWYWSFGWLYGKDVFTHIKYIGTSHLFNNIKQHFTRTVFTTDKDLWVFCEISASIYTLKECAELFHRGGSHYMQNPCKELLTQHDWEHHINAVLIPSLIDEFYKVLKV